MAVWITVLAVPRTRDYAWKIEDEVTADGIFYNRTAFGQPPANKLSGDYPRAYQRLLVRDPNNRDLLIAYALARSIQNDPQPLRALAQRLPKDPLPIALQLAEGLDHLEDKRFDGPLTNFYYPRKPPAVVPMTPAEKSAFGKMAQLARQGQRLDPNNAFFDGCLIYCLFALRRDREALAVLAVGAGKSTYNDYTLAGVRARYNARRLYRIPSPVEATALYVISSDSVAVMHIFRQLPLLIMDQAILARQKHDPATTLAAGIYLMRMSAVVRRKSLTSWSAMNAVVMESKAILAVQPRKGVGGRTAALARADNLAGLAVSMHRPDLAAEVMTEWRTLQRWRAVGGVDLEVISGVPPSVLFGTQILEQAAAFIWYATRWVLLLWGILWFVFGVRHRFPEKTFAARAAVWGGIAGILALLATLLIDICLITRPFHNGWGQVFSNYIGGLALQRCGPWWMAGFPLTILTACALFLTGRQQRAWMPAPINAESELTKIGGQNRLNRTLERFFPVLAIWSLILPTAAFPIWYFIVQRADVDAYQYSSFFLVLWGAMLCLPQLYLLLRRPRRAEALRSMAVNLSGIFGGYLMVMWLCLGLAILAALPGLLNFDAQFQRTLQVGEMPLYRTMAGL